MLSSVPLSFGSATAALGAHDDPAIALRVSGGKPLRVRGSMLAQCSSWSAGAPAWHELVLYDCGTDGCAVGVTTCRGPMGDSDVSHARLFSDLEAALAWLQAFDPTADLDAAIDSSDRRISTTDIALRAAALRQCADRVEKQYRVLVGELLYRLETGE
ncbi:MAG: hypothetical protein B7Z80_05905 [Rhodospirillales bacterium 20-64-7]|nr:MAG: hypothetical protein B7Z80_05905 [Rhodospirillales bacterium 20-64-7]